MNRREYIKKTSLVAATALLPKLFTNYNNLPAYKMGYQLYSIRDRMAKDPIKTLKALKQLGYQDFETYGFDGEQMTFYGFKVTDFKTILDDLEITTSSGHYWFAPFMEQSDDKLKKYVELCINGAKAINCKYITWPKIELKHQNLDGFKLLASKLNLIGEQVNQAGLSFAYHNHGYEFDDYNGQNGFDIIAKETDAKYVKFQMDMYWIIKSSQTPKEIVKQHPGRIVMWHIKDMDKITKDYTELGHGSINYVDILPDPIKSGLQYYYIEQGGNYTHDSLKSAAASAEYFKKHLQKFL